MLPKIWWPSLWYAENTPVGEPIWLIVVMLAILTVFFLAITTFILSVNRVLRSRYKTELSALKHHVDDLRRKAEDYFHIMRYQHFPESSEMPSMIVELAVFASEDDIAAGSYETLTSYSGTLETLARAIPNYFFPDNRKPRELEYAVAVNLNDYEHQRTLVVPEGCRRRQDNTRVALFTCLLVAAALTNQFQYPPRRISYSVRSPDQLLNVFFDENWRDAFDIPWDVVQAVKIFSEKLHKHCKDYFRE